MKAVACKLLFVCFGGGGKRLLLLEIYELCLNLIKTPPICMIASRSYRIPTKFHAFCVTWIIYSWRQSWRLDMYSHVFWCTLTFCICMDLWSLFKLLLCSCCSLDSDTLAAVFRRRPDVLSLTHLVCQRLIVRRTIHADLAWATSGFVSLT